MDAVAMHVQCATPSCGKVTAVPYAVLGKLLQSPHWICPHCQQGNVCNMEPQVQQTLAARLASVQQQAQTDAARPAAAQQQHASVDALPDLDLPPLEGPGPVTSGGLHSSPSGYGAVGPPPVQTGAAMADGGYSNPMSMQQRQMLHERASMDDLTGHKRKQPEPWQNEYRGVPEAGTVSWDQWGNLTSQPEPVQPPLAEDDESGEEQEEAETFADYKPSKLLIGRPHPDPVVETASLAAVQPPDINYMLRHAALEEKLSALQLESITYACQRHQEQLPDGSRAGFFIGDGAGVGKGRTIAGLIAENWACGRRRHVWLSVGNDLRLDSLRDLADVGREDVQVYPINKLAYGGPKATIGDGVMFSTYSSLISQSDKGHTRLHQMAEWCSSAEGCTRATFDGLIIFDECHKAKNLVPEAGSKPTKVGLTVLELQKLLPQARIVYCSATGASEPRNLGYMERLGLWGAGNLAFSDFAAFLDAVNNRGVGALELIAMDMKARGMYVCRTLSFKGAEFETIMAELEEPVASQYEQAAEMWNGLRREFLYSVELAEEGAAMRSERRPRSMLWRSYWSAHQRFFRSMCMAAKIPALVRLTKRALADGKCVVVGLQSTGDARTADVVAEKGEELEDFVSGPRELMFKLLDDNFPLPTLPPEMGGDEGKGRRGKRKSARAASARGRGRGRGKAKKEDSDSDLEVVEGLSSPAASPQHDGGPRASTPEQQALLQRYNELVKRREQVREVVAALPLPNNPLDTLIDELGGPDAVAEMTGRKGRLVRQQNGRNGVRWEARNASAIGPNATLELINVHERQLFLDLKKRIAVISEAASAGISLHADRRCINQQRRVHLTLELPWSADRAIQQGDRRAGPSLQAFNFESTLGRQALKQTYNCIAEDARTPIEPPACKPGPDGAAPDLPSRAYFFGQARAHLLSVGVMTPEKHVTAVEINDMLKRPSGAPPGVGKIADNDKTDIPRFLNRLLGLAPLAQKHVFDFYIAMFEHVVDDAKKTGKYDEGVVDIKGTSITLTKEPEVIRVDEQTGAPTLLYSILVDRGVPWALALQKLAAAQAGRWADAASNALAASRDDDAADDDPLAGLAGGAAAGGQQPAAAAAAAAGKGASRHAGFYRTLHAGVQGKHHTMLALEIPSRPGQFTVVRPATGHAPKPMKLDELESRYERLDISDAEEPWEDAYIAAEDRTGLSTTFKPGQRMREVLLLGGLVLPVWNTVRAALAQQQKASDRRMQVLRIQTTGFDSRRLVGMLLPQLAGQQVLKELHSQEQARQAAAARAELLQMPPEVQWGGTVVGQHGRTPDWPGLSSQHGMDLPAVSGLGGGFEQAQQPQIVVAGGVPEGFASSIQGQLRANSSFAQQPLTAPQQPVALTQSDTLRITLRQS